MLVAAGASLTTRDANGLTPMMIAFQVEDNDLATYLESKLRISFHFISFDTYDWIVSCERTLNINSVVEKSGIACALRVKEELLASANFKCRMEPNTFTLNTCIQIKWHNTCFNCLIPFGFCSTTFPFGYFQRTHKHKFSRLLFIHLCIPRSRENVASRVCRRHLNEIEKFAVHPRNAVLHITYVCVCTRKLNICHWPIDDDNQQSKWNG